MCARGRTPREAFFITSNKHSLFFSRCFPLLPLCSWDREKMSIFMGLIDMVFSVAMEKEQKHLLSLDGTEPSEMFCWFMYAP